MKLWNTVWKFTIIRSFSFEKWVLRTHRQEIFWLIEHKLILKPFLLAASYASVIEVWFCLFNDTNSSAFGIVKREIAWSKFNNHYDFEVNLKNMDYVLM